MKKHKKKVPIWVKALACFILLTAGIIVGFYLFINMELNKINRPDNSKTIPTVKKYYETDVAWNTSCDPGEGFNYTENAIENITWPSEAGVLKNKDVINILLIGQDRRPGESRKRSDSMMIGTIDKKNNTIKITSLMRDLYVQIPGHGDNRINAAYALGGMELLDKTIEKNFQVHIDGNVEVDFERFERVIDIIGGIDIPVNAVEAAYLEGQGFIGLSEGMVHMDGPLALAYSRIRYVGNSDYERTERQKRLITTAFKNIKDLELPKILALVDETFPLLTTDLTNGQIISFATYAAMMDTDGIETYRIPADGTFRSVRIRNMAVLVPDLNQNRIALRDIIYEDK